MTSQQTGGMKPTRRTLVKGAAWSVPVVAVGGAAPAFAASPVFEITGTTIGCKISNQKVYHLEIQIQNTGNQPATIADVTLTGTNSAGDTIVFPAPADQCMCPGATYVLVVNSENQGGGNISSFGASISWDELTGPVALSVPDNTPDCNASDPPAQYDDMATPLLATWIHVSGPTGCTCA